MAIDAIKKRLEALEVALDGLQKDADVYVLEDGALFAPPQGRDYIKEHGTYAPDGRRIIHYKPYLELGQRPIDGLSRSLIEWEEEKLQTARTEAEMQTFWAGYIRTLKSDPLP